MTNCIAFTSLIGYNKRVETCFKNTRKEGISKMRKQMTKEVTSTVIKLATIEVSDGVPMAVELPPEILLGSVTPDKAQKILSKQLGKDVTVLSAEPKTEVYVMDVEEFIQLASLKEDEVEEETVQA